MFKRGLLFSPDEGTPNGGGTTTTTTENISLKDSVLKAFDEATKAEGAVPVGETKTEGEEEVEKEEEEKVETAAKEEEEKEEDAIEVDASPEEIKSALQLFRSLINPETSVRVVKDLAEAGGYDLTKKQEVRQLERDAKAILKEKLGDSYDLLSGDKLAEAFETILAAEVDKRTKPVVDKLAIAEQQANVEKANSAMDAMWSRHKVSDPKVREKVAGQMLDKMKAMPATKDADLNTYLDDIYTLVTRDQERARTVKTTVRKIQNNAQEARAASGEGSGTDETRVRQGSRLPSIKEAVSAAFRNERLE